MKILLDGYFDKNLGDDLMLTLAANGLKEHELYIPSDKIRLENVTYTTAKKDFDAYLKVTGSGFLIHNNPGIAYHLRDMRREKNYAPIRAVISCNISDFINRASEAVIKKHLGQFDFITTRDTFSYDYIKASIPDLSCEKYPDIVLSLPDSMIPDAPREQLLGIAVHNGIDSETLAAAADGYISETGGSVLLLCFDSGLENDASAARTVMEKAKYKEKISISVYKNIPDMLYQIKRCAVIIGVRLHASLLAARMGVPFLPIAYSDKTPNALKEAGYSTPVLRAHNAGAEDILKGVLCPPDFVLGSGVISAAERHLITFNEFLRLI